MFGNNNNVVGLLMTLFAGGGSMFMGGTTGIVFFLLSVAAAYLTLLTLSAAVDLVIKLRLWILGFAVNLILTFFLLSFCAKNAPACEDITGKTTAAIAYVFGDVSGLFRKWADHMSDFIAK